VLIFERIKEELATARGARAAVQRRIRSCVVDDCGHPRLVAYRRTAASAVRHQHHSRIRGHADHRLLSNVFTAVFVSRTAFEMVLNRRQGAGAQTQTLSI
jgi:hypothetical protein